MGDFKVVEKTFPSREPESGIPPETRWIIVDIDDSPLDDAGGYGYKTKQNAMKAGWYKFQGGRNKIDEIKSWWKQNKAFSKRLNDFQEWNFKEIARDEIDFEEESIKIAKEMNVDGFEVTFLKYL
jgi:hypothetical protein